MLRCKPAYHAQHQHNTRHCQSCGAPCCVLVHQAPTEHCSNQGASWACILQTRFFCSKLLVLLNATSNKRCETARCTAHLTCLHETAACNGWQPVGTHAHGARRHAVYCRNGNSADPAGTASAAACSLPPNTPPQTKFIQCPAHRPITANARLLRGAGSTPVSSQQQQQPPLVWHCFQPGKLLRQPLPQLT